jgi:cytochrome P450
MIRTMEDPIAWYDEIRERQRLLWHPESDSWYVTRFDDVWDLLVDGRLGARSTDTFTDKMTAEQRSQCSGLVDFVTRWPVFSDMPRHTDVHRLILPAFGAEEARRILRKVVSHLAETGNSPGHGAETLYADALDAGKVALTEFLGLFPEELDRLPGWSGKLIAFVGQGEDNFDEQIVAEANHALDEFTEFVSLVCARRGSVLSERLSAAMAAGEFELADAVAVYGQMVTGFLQPTMSALAFSIERLTEHERYRLFFDEDQEAFISESIRLASPFHFAPRRALEDIVLDGQTIPAGDRVVLVLVAANRDGRRFPNPLEFRIDRGRLPHVAFARGRYACLGASLARQVMGAVLTAVRKSAFGELPPLHATWNISWGMRMAEGLAPSRPLHKTEVVGP